MAKVSAPFLQAYQGGYRYLASLKDTGPIARIKGRIQELRKYLMPLDDADYLATSYDDILAGGAYSGIETSNTLNPAPYELFKRSTAGFLSFHHSPFDKFFNTKVLIDTQLPSEALSQIDTYLRFRDERVHSILQHPHNIAQEALFILNRLVFNIGIKVIEEDKELIMKKTTFPIESLILESSDGRNQDIVGVFEDLSWFQFHLRFPNPLHKVESAERNKEAFTMRGQGPGKDIRVFRFNMKIPVFKAFFEGYLASDPRFKTEFKRHMRGKFPTNAEYVDVEFTERGELLTFAAREYKTIIVSHLSFITKDGLRGKGQGDLAVSTAAALQESEEILMNAYERMFGPAWAAPSELESQAFQEKLRRDGIVYTDQGEGIRPLLVQYDLRTAKELILSWEQRLEKLAFLDIFTLIDKSRMPTQEISMRRSDGFRQLALYVTADTAYNLEPEVVACLKIDQEMNRIPPLQVPGKSTLRVSYTSPIIQSIKQSALESYRALNQVFSEMVPIMAQPNPIAESVNYSMMVDRILEKSDNAELSIDEETKQARQQEAAEMRRIQIEKQAAEANAVNAQAIQASVPPGGADVGGVPGAGGGGAPGAGAGDAGGGLGLPGGRPSPGSPV